MTAYLVTCGAFGLALGRVAGVASRGSWRYPLSLARVATPRRDFIVFFGDYEAANFACVALLGVLELWGLLRAARPPRPPARRSGRLAYGCLLAVAVAAVLAASGRGLALLTLPAAAVYAATASWLLATLCADARGVEGGSFARRFLAAAPVPVGLGVALAASIFTLGYRGESAMIHAFVLVLALGVTLAGLILAALVATLPGLVRIPGIHAS